MLVELRVCQLGVIDDLTLVLGPGMTALTGETGAGKTLLVEAIELLLGGRADPVLVRPGAPEATVEGRFAEAGPDGDDLIMARVVPVSGRSRAYLDGRMANLTALAVAGEPLVDLHGQHAHQSLLAPAVQRAALDAAGAIDHSDLLAARQHSRAVEAALAGLGGDARARARELDLLRFQLDEIERAGLEDPDEDAALAIEEDRLADAAAHREAAGEVYQALAGDDGALDRLGTAIAALNGRRPLAPLQERLRSVEADLGDVARDARLAVEGFEDDPERLAEVSGRRQLLRELVRKYGDSLAEVVEYRRHVGQRLSELESFEERAGALDRERVAAERETAQAEQRLGDARRAQAPRFGDAVERQLRTLAMPRARFEVSVGADRAGEAVTWLLAANPGEPALPLAKVASGGELARAMLAARLVLSGVASAGPDGASARPDGEAAARPRRRPLRTLVFDEVDAGIGGEAAVAGGAALAALGHPDQVVVVTHLPQVAAVAHHHVVVTKDLEGSRTVAHVRAVQGEARVEELSRMLSGRPDSVTARRHASELLGVAGGGSVGAGRSRPAKPR